LAIFEFSILYSIFASVPDSSQVVGFFREEIPNIRPGWFSTIEIPGEKKAHPVHAYFISDGR